MTMKPKTPVHLASKSTFEQSGAAFYSGHHVSDGQPLALDPNEKLTQGVHASLEEIAKTHLLATEEKGKELLEKAEQQAQAITEKAKQDYEEMIRLARSEVDGIKESAYEEGFKAGFEEGYQEATAQVAEEVKTTLQSANLLIETAQKAQQQLLKKFNQNMLEIINNIATKILNQSVCQSPENILEMVDQAVHQLYLTGKVKIVLNPEVIHNLRQLHSDTEAALERMNRFEFIPDEKLQQDQIFIIGTDVCFNLTPENQVKTLVTALESHMTLPENSLSEELPPPESPSLESDRILQPDHPEISFTDSVTSSFSDAMESESDEAPHE